MTTQDQVEITGLDVSAVHAEDVHYGDSDADHIEAMLLPGDEPEKLNTSWIVAAAFYVAASAVGFLYIVVPLTMFVWPFVDSVDRALVIAVALSTAAIIAIRLVLRRMLVVRELASNSRGGGK